MSYRATSVAYFAIAAFLYSANVFGHIILRSSQTGVTSGLLVSAFLSLVVGLIYLVSAETRGWKKSMKVFFTARNFIFPDPPPDEPLNPSRSEKAGRSTSGQGD